MSRYHRPAKVDKNQSEIFKHLRDHGVYVKDLSGAGSVSDAFVCGKGARGAELGFLEIKISGSKAKYTRQQLLWISELPETVPVFIATTKEDALEFANNAREKGLTIKQKNALAGFLKFNPAKFFQPAEIEKVLGISQRAEVEK